MKTLFAVPWIEVEYGWGDRPEGFKVFDNLEECISSSKESSATGNYESGGGYFGPERPLHYYEIPDETPDGVEVKYPTWMDKLKFKSDPKAMITSIT